MITNDGGPGVMATDTLTRHGLEPAPLETETIRRLDDLLPPFWTRSNPIDILGDASADRFRRTLEVCLGGPKNWNNQENFEPKMVSILFLGLFQPAAVLWYLSDGRYDVSRHIHQAWPVFKEAIVSKGTEEYSAGEGQPAGP
jgi:hypothetical protein